MSINLLKILKRALVILTFGLAALSGMNGIVAAQDNPPRRNEKTDQQSKKNDERRKDADRKRRERDQYEAIERERRQAQRNERRILAQQASDVERIEQFREEQRIKNQNNRYRITHEGRDYEMNYDGSELLKQSLNSGYQQGYQVGKDDHKAKRGETFSESLIYQNATTDYQSDVVDLNLYQYYFREGFQRGYADGYRNQKQYGKSTNGIRFISDTVSQQILNIQQF